MIEMLVVLGIVALVTAMTLPMIIPMMRTRKLDSAVDTVKSAIILARSKAVQSRRMMNLTLFQQTDATHGAGMIITDYDTLRETISGVVTAPGSDSYQVIDSNQNWNSYPTSIRGMPIRVFHNGAYQLRIITAITNSTTITCEPSQQPLTWSPQITQQPWNPLPAPGDTYAIPAAASPQPTPYCAHYLNNYAYNNPDVRFNALKAVCLSMGEQLRYLPEGCDFDFTNFSPPIGTDPLASDPNAAMTYVFLPNGEVWTLQPSASNSRDPYWSATTFMAGAVPSGPMILGLASPSLPTVQTRLGPKHRMAATIVVYGTTGQVVSQ
jgi:type II secretory pathway pseudopilin PulG